MTNPNSVAVLREMLPCPFCGEVPTIANIRSDENQGTKWGGVVCSCGIVGPEVRTGYEPVAKWADRAAEAWNERRPAPPGSDADMRAWLSDYADILNDEGKTNEAAKVRAALAARTGKGEANGR